MTCEGLERSTIATHVRGCLARGNEHNLPSMVRGMVQHSQPADVVGGLKDAGCDNEKIRLLLSDHISADKLEELLV